MEHEIQLAFAIIALAFAAFGLLFFGIGLALLRRERAFVRSALGAEGTVVGFERRRSRSRAGRRRGMVYRDHPVVRYTTQAGWQAQFASSFGTSPRLHREGQRVPVLYNPVDPADARIASGGGVYGPPHVFLVLGVAFVGFGGLFGAIRWFAG